MNALYNTEQNAMLEKLTSGNGIIPYDGIETYLSLMMTFARRQTQTPEHAYCITHFSPVSYSFYTREAAGTASDAAKAEMKTVDGSLFNDSTDYLRLFTCLVSASLNKLGLIPPRINFAQPFGTHNGADPLVKENYNLTSYEWRFALTSFQFEGLFRFASITTPHKIFMDSQQVELHCNSNNCVNLTKILMKVRNNTTDLLTEFIPGKNGNFEKVLVTTLAQRLSTMTRRQHYLFSMVFHQAVRDQKNGVPYEYSAEEIGARIFKKLEGNPDFDILSFMELFAPLYSIITLLIAGNHMGFSGCVSEGPKWLDMALHISNGDIYLNEEMGNRQNLVSKLFLRNLHSSSQDFASESMYDGDVTPDRDIEDSKLTLIKQRLLRRMIKEHHIRSTSHQRCLSMCQFNRWYLSMRRIPQCIASIWREYHYIISMWRGGQYPKLCLLSSYSQHLGQLLIPCSVLSQERTQQQQEEGRLLQLRTISASLGVLTTTQSSQERLLLLQFPPTK